MLRAILQALTFAWPISEIALAIRLRARKTASLADRGSTVLLLVAIDKDHSLVLVGPFRWVRHPAYTGLLLAFLGVGLSLSNWLSVALVMVPISLALLYRIEVEERALGERFGAAYERYAARTKRLIPWLY